MTTIRLILAGVILALIIGLYYSLSAAFTAKSELKGTKASLAVAIAQNEGLARAAAEVQAQVQHVQTKSTKLRQSTEHAIHQEPDWASTAVPAVVIDELCASLRCVTPTTR